MKFVHMADMHFDAPFSLLNTKKNLGETRRLEQRNAFKEIINYIKEHNVKYFFIAGDLYEQDYVRRSTIDFINDCFRQIPNTKIFITPGNHDPYIKDSYYDNYEFERNVYIFKTNKLEKYEDENVVIYGMAFTDFYMNTSAIKDIKVAREGKPNILLIHADVNGKRDENGYEYNSVPERSLKDTGFDYIALGHIHKSNFEENKDYVYPGSTISFGFDELGRHGFVAGEINGGLLEKEFIEVDNRVFEEYFLNVDSFTSKEALIEYILDIDFEKNHMYKLVLEGKRGFDIDEREILKSISDKNILKIKNNTRISYDLDALKKEKNLKGIFVKKVLEEAKSGYYTDEQIQKAIEIGLQAME